MIAEFPARQRKQRTLYYSVTRIDSTGSCESLPNSGRYHSVRTDSDIELVNDLILQPRKTTTGTSKSPREIESGTGISHSSVVRIAKNDLQLKVFRRREVQFLNAADKLRRLNARKRLKKRAIQSKISRTWF